MSDAPDRRSPVLFDVARHAGVSHQTVSRVINGHPSVAPATRERVERVIAELGYLPNKSARALVTRSTRTLGLVTVNINQFGPAQTMLGLEQAARAAGYSLSVVMLEDASSEEMRAAIDGLLASSVDGILALATYDAAAEALRSVSPRVPLVAVQIGGDHHHPTVYVDQVAGARLATRHLLDLGHTVVHHVAGPLDSQEARGRIEGWRLELEAAGLDVTDPWYGDWWPPSGYQVGKRLADVVRSGSANRPTAVFVANDQMSLGILHALREEGISVPRDLSLVGFDDVPEAPFFAPPLTTIRQNFAELGRRGVRLVLSLLTGEDLLPQPVPPQLIVRQSTAGPT
jgi:DNA-binding LacI/PurR family transcriptional regulator